MLKILVVGWNRRLCHEALIEALSDHAKQLIIHSDGVIDPVDNTIYHIITNKMNDPKRFQWAVFDQIIYVDDFRLELTIPMVIDTYLSIINEVLPRSCVPKEYRVIHYEYPLTTEEQKNEYYKRTFLTRL